MVVPSNQVAADQVVQVGERIHLTFGRWPVDQVGTFLPLFATGVIE